MVQLRLTFRHFTNSLSGTRELLAPFDLTDSLLRFADSEMSSSSAIYLFIIFFRNNSGDQQKRIRDLFVLNSQTERSVETGKSLAPDASVAFASQDWGRWVGTGETLAGDTTGAGSKEARISGEKACLVKGEGGEEGERNQSRLLAVCRGVNEGLLSRIRKLMTFLGPSWIP